jgi:hypothetical protein
MVVILPLHRSFSSFLFRSSSLITTHQTNPNRCKMAGSQQPKSQPWKKNWPPQDLVGQAELTAEEMDLQRSYGTHASNTKGKIFQIDNKPKSQ